MHQSDFRVEIVLRRTCHLRLRSFIRGHVGQVFQVQVVCDLSVLCDLIDFIFSYFKKTYEGQDLSSQRAKEFNQSCTPYIDEVF